MEVMTYRIRIQSTALRCVCYMNLLALAACGSQANPVRFEGNGEFSVRNGDVSISAFLDLPDGQGPFPAILIVQGTGKKNKLGEQKLAEFFVNRKIAVLRYDKRSVGQTSGTWIDIYSDRAAPDAASVWFGQLAGDAAALVVFLTNHVSIRPGRIGLFGISEGGGIAPLIVARTSALRFVISNVGFTHPVGSYDPAPLIRDMTVPVLWQFGARDQIVPPDRSVPILERVLSEVALDFTIVVYANSDHGMNDEVRRVKSPFMQDAFDWLVSRGFLE